MALDQRRLITLGMREIHMSSRNPEVLEAVGHHLSFTRAAGEGEVAKAVNCHRLPITMEE